MSLGAIDIVMNPFTEQEVNKGQTGYDQNFMEQVRMPADIRGGLSIERHLAIMDEARVDHALSPEGFTAVGRDVESVVLARADASFARGRRWYERLMEWF